MRQTYQRVRSAHVCALLTMDCRSICALEVEGEDAAVGSNESELELAVIDGHELASCCRAFQSGVFDFARSRGSWCRASRSGRALVLVLGQGLMSSLDQSGTTTGTGTRVRTSSSWSSSSSARTARREGAR